VDPAEYYKPPKADPTAAPGGGPLSTGTRLSSIRQIAVATFFGGPLAGTILMAQNARAAGRPESARKTIIAGVIALLLVVVLAPLLPARTPNSLLPLLYVVAIQSAARSLQGPMLGEHFGAGGAKQSNWRVAAVALGCLALMVAVLLVEILIVAGRRV
jgi:hypothetical protein